MFLEDSPVNGLQKLKKIEDPGLFLDTIVFGIIIHKDHVIKNKTGL